MDSQEMSALLANTRWQKTAMEWSLRTIAKLHHQHPDGACNECYQPYPCITRQEALAHIDGSRGGDDAR